MTDEVLHRRIAPGPDAEFGALYTAAAPRIYLYLLRLTGDSAEATELLQETFVRAWRGLDRFRGDSTVLTWLYAIATRTTLEMRRSWWRRETVALSDADDAAQVICQSTPEGRIDLERAIAQLPPRARIALLLHAVEGHSQAEVAACLGVTEGTVKSQVHRARSLLRKALKL